MGTLGILCFRHFTLCRTANSSTLHRLSPQRLEAETLAGQDWDALAEQAGQGGVVGVLFQAVPLVNMNV